MKVLLISGERLLFGRLLCYKGYVVRKKLQSSRGSYIVYEKEISSVVGGSHGLWYDGRLLE